METPLILVAFIAAVQCHYNFFVDYVSRNPSALISTSFEDQRKHISKYASLDQLEAPESDFLRHLKVCHCDVNLLQVIKDHTIFPDPAEESLESNTETRSSFLRELCSKKNNDELKELLSHIQYGVTSWMVSNCHKEILPEHSFLFSISEGYGSWHNFISEFRRGDQQLNPYILYAISSVLEINFVVFSALSPEPTFISDTLSLDSHSLTKEGIKRPVCPIGCIINGDGSSLSVIPLKCVNTEIGEDTVKEDQSSCICVSNDDQLILPEVEKDWVERNVMEPAEELFCRRNSSFSTEDDKDEKKILSENDLRILCQWEPFDRIIGTDVGFDQRIQCSSVSDIASIQMVLKAIAQEISAPINDKFIFKARKGYLNRKQRRAALSLEKSRISARIATKVSTTEIERRLSSQCRPNCWCLSIFKTLDFKAVVERVQTWRKKFYYLPAGDRFLLLVSYVAKQMFGCEVRREFRGIKSDVKNQALANMQSETIFNYYSLDDVFDRIERESETSKLSSDEDNIVDLPRIKSFTLWQSKFCQEAFRLITGISGELLQKARNFIRNRQSCYVQDEGRYLLANSNSKFMRARAWFASYIRDNADYVPNKQMMMLPYALKESIYQEMKSFFESINTHERDIPSLSTFREMWLTDFPHVKVRRSSPFNKCPVCQYYRSQQQHCASNDKVRVLL